MNPLRGLPGHPSHPPLTDATIGIYTFATLAAILSKLGVAEHGFAQAWWLALILGLISTIATASTGFLDWLHIPGGTPLWRTATVHLAVMVTATVAFAIAAGAGKGAYDDQKVTTGLLLVTLIGYVILAIGGWLGGAITYVHGMRVLNLAEEPATRAASPVPKPEKAEAERS